MTITYDPSHAKYFDEPDLRSEMTRVYDLCHGCRMCVNLCTSFPSLFSIIDAHDLDAAKMTAAEQDRVVDECFGCKMCYVKCPYIPGQHEWELDFPRLMLRAHAVKKAKNGRTLADQVFGRTDAMGRLATKMAPLANKSIEKPGSLQRKMLAKIVGIASQRVLPPYAKTRFSTWFRRRAVPILTNRQAKVAVFPTCVVEYQNPAIGQDLVKVYEHNGVECHLPKGTVCCGAPWLHSGDVENFRAQAAKNLGPLAEAVRSGYDIVVPQPTCGYVLKKDYPDYFRTTQHEDEATLVAAHTFDAAEYLWRLHKGEGTSLVTNFSAAVPATATYHAACHLQAQNVGLKGRDLIKLTGTKISLVSRCSGIDGTWGYREANYAIAKKVAKPMGEAIRKAASEVVVGDCSLANGAIAEETGATPMHPLQFLARAYGIAEEPKR